MKYKKLIHSILYSPNVIAEPLHSLVRPKRTFHKHQKSTYTLNEKNVVLENTKQNVNHRTTGINFLKKFAKNLPIANSTLPSINGKFQGMIQVLSVLQVIFHKKTCGINTTLRLLYLSVSPLFSAS